MEKIWNFIKPYGEDVLHFATDLLKSGAKAAGKFIKNITVKTANKLLGKAAPVCKIVMIAAAGVAALSGVIWFFGRKK